MQCSTLKIILVELYSWLMPLLHRFICSEKMHLLTHFVRSLRYKTKWLAAGTDLFSLPCVCNIPQTVFAASHTSTKQTQTCGYSCVSLPCKFFAMFLAKTPPTNQLQWLCLFNNCNSYSYSEQHRSAGPIHIYL